MATQPVDGYVIRRAIEEYGSFKKAIEVLKNEIAALEGKKASLEEALKNEIATLEDERASLEKENSQRENRNSELEMTKDETSTAITDMANRLTDKKFELNRLSQDIERDRRQYELFQGFLAMIIHSTSESRIINTLIPSLQELANPGWRTWKSNEELRSLFMRRVFGDHLKSFRCKRCGSSFIFKPGSDKIRINPSICLACNSIYEIKPDDSFLKAMVSEEQLENVHTAERYIEENEKLEPLNVFLEVKCEICGEPIQEWTENNIFNAKEGYGWAHNQCWQSAAGIKIIFEKTAQILKEEQEKSRAAQVQPLINLTWPL